jgi:hypothetical protein
MRLLYFSLLGVLITSVLWSCHKTKEFNDYSDSIIKPRHWTGHIARSDYSYPCCQDTFSRIIADSTFSITKPRNSMIQVGNDVQLRYSSTDPVAHTVTYDTVFNAGTVSPFGYHLIYYYLLDSSVFSYSGKTLSTCGADYFYQVFGVFTTSH